MKKAILNCAIAFTLIGCTNGLVAPPSTGTPATVGVAPPKTQAERCDLLLSLLGNQYLNDWQKMAAYEKARNEGCLS